MPRTALADYNSHRSARSGWQSDPARDAHRQGSVLARERYRTHRWSGIRAQRPPANSKHGITCPHVSAELIGLQTSLPTRPLQTTPRSIPTGVCASTCHATG